MELFFYSPVSVHRAGTTFGASPRPCLEPNVETKASEEQCGTKGSKRPTGKQRLKENNAETKAQQEALGLLSARCAPGASRKPHGNAGTKTQGETLW